MERRGVIPYLLRGLYIRSNNVWKEMPGLLAQNYTDLHHQHSGEPRWWPLFVLLSFVFSATSNYYYTTPVPFVVCILFEIFGAIIPIDANWPKKKRKKNFVSFSFEKTNKRDRLCIYLKCLYYLLRLLRTILYYYARCIRSPRLYNTMPDWRHIPSWLSATEKNRVYFKLDDGRREENRLQNDCDVDVNIIHT